MSETKQTAIMCEDCGNVHSDDKPVVTDPSDKDMVCLACMGRRGDEHAFDDWSSHEHGDN